MADIVTELKGTLANLKKVREPFEAEVDEVIKFVDPSIRTITDKTKGARTGREIYDGSARSALNLLVDGMTGYLCSQNIRWFKFTLPVKYRWGNGITQRLDEMREVKLWLQELEEVRYSTLSRSNFYDKMPMFIRGGAGVGTASVYVEEDMDGQMVVFKVPHFRECYIAENQFGHPDTHYRKYQMTLKQMAEKFGREKLESLDRNFANDYKNDPYKEHCILHAIYPRKDRDPELSNGGNKPIASQWIDLDINKLVLDSGYDSAPVVSWRWRKNTDEVYGRSPAWDAMVDVKLANQQGRSNIKGGHKMVEPPMIGPKILRGMINNTPNGWTFADINLNDQAPRPLQTGIQLPFGIEMQQRQQQIIREHFASDYFMLLTRTATEYKTELTATQVIQMMGEQAAILGTRVGMFQSEALDPIHERLFEIERRAGWIPDPPDVVMEATNGKPKVEYLGPLAQAQKWSSETRSLRGGIQIIAELANLDPTIMDNYDWDEVARYLSGATGFPEKLLRDPAERDKIREERQAQIEAQQAAESAEPLAKAARMAGFKPEEGSPLDQAMNGEG